MLIFFFECAWQEHLTTRLSAALRRSDAVRQSVVEPRAEPERRLQAAAREGLPVHGQGRLRALL